MRSAQLDISLHYSDDTRSHARPLALEGTFTLIQQKEKKKSNMVLGDRGACGTRDPVGIVERMQ